MKTPLVSVIIPCYNQARFLRQAIDSVLCQSLDEFECIVINDGSEDDTADVVRMYRDSQRLRYIEQKNHGLSATRNIGLSQSKGQFVQFLDSDDFIHPEKLMLQVELLKEQEQFGASHSDFICLDETASHVLRKYASPELDGNSFLSNLLLRWERGLSIPPHCFLFRAEAIAGLTFDESLPGREDWDFWIRAAHRGVQTIFLPQELAFYRIHANSMSRQKQPMEYSKELVLEKAATLSPFVKFLVEERGRQESLVRFP